MVETTETRLRGRPPLDVSVILSRGGSLFFPGTVPEGVIRRLNRGDGWLRKQGFVARTLDNYVKDGVQGVSVYAVPVDAVGDPTWAPRSTSRDSEVREAIEALLRALTAEAEHEPVVRVLLRTMPEFASLRAILDRSSVDTDPRPEAGPTRLAPVAYAQGHGKPDYCEEHGDIDRHESIVHHIEKVHGLTYEAWRALEEADRVRGIEPFDPHDHHDCDAINRAASEAAPVVGLDVERLATP